MNSSASGRTLGSPTQEGGPEGDSDGSAPPRRRFLRAGCWFPLLAVVVLWFGSQLGWSPPERFRVLRADGSPAAGAWIAFHYRGHRCNFVDSIEYVRGGGVVRADAEGRVVLPGRFYRKAPFDAYLQPWIDLLYDPGSHYASMAGRRQVSHAGFLESRANGSELVVTDRSGNPTAWERSLEELYALISYELVHRVESDREPRIRVSRDQLRELADALRSDYRALVERHGDTPRQPPEPDAYFRSRSAAEQEEIRDRIRADLERAPLWIDRLEHEWPEKLEELDRAIERRH